MALLDWLLSILKKPEKNKDPLPAPAPVAPAPAAAPPKPEPKPKPQHITMQDYLMGRDALAPLTDEMKQNAQITVDKVNQLLDKFGSRRGVNSGYRPAAVNQHVKNAAPNSKHLTCQACDLEDSDGKLRDWIIANLAVPKEIGLWMEDFRWTPGWCHVQIVPPASKKRIYIPSTKPPLNPNAWSGVYDKAYD